MLSTWVSPFTHGYADFYSWDGSALRTIDSPGNLLASRDGRYFVNYTAGQLWSATGQMIRPYVEPPGSTALNWAADGDYFCGLDQNATGYDLVVVDVPGNVQRFPLDVPPALVTPDGLRALGVGCSLTAHRAVVFGGSAPNSLVAVQSLPDGHLVRIVQLSAGGHGVIDRSPDMRWLAVTNTTNSSPGWETEIVDLTDGSVQAKVAGYFGFTPDGQNLVGNNQHWAATILDWRTMTELWTGVGHAQVMAASDPSTNKALLWLSTGSSQGGTDTYDFWIVDGAGSAIRFTPTRCLLAIQTC
jgi:hypothetical protein